MQTTFKLFLLCLFCLSLCLLSGCGNGNRSTDGGGTSGVQPVTSELADAFNWNEIEDKQQYIQSVKKIVNDHLKHPENEFFQTVKRAHPLVTIKSGSVAKCQVQTIDGSDSLGTDGSNIGSMTIQLTVFWDANLQKNKRTVIEIVCSPGSSQDFSTNIVETDGKATVDDPAWWAELGKGIVNILPLPIRRL